MLSYHNIVRFHFYLLLFIFSFYTGCNKNPVENDYNQVLLEKAFNTARQHPRMRSMIVSIKGKVVEEEYFNQVAPEDLYNVKSVTKSFTSALVGIAIREGFIDSVNQTLADFLSDDPFSIDSEKGKITIKQLLTMTYGLEWRQVPEYTEIGIWKAAPNQVEYIFNKPFVDQPGQKFNYSDGAPHLLSVILTEASGMSTKAFAETYLFGPLEISPTEWLTDKQGYYYGGVTLHITPKDMLKFGMLYLNKGKYKNIQIIPSHWIAESSSDHISTETPEGYGSKYGYLWWVDRVSSHDYYFANGYGGQLIFIVPDLEMVCVTTCNTNGLTRSEAFDQWIEVYNIIIQQIVSAVL